MSRMIDLTGRVFGRLTVLGYSHTTITPSGQKKPHWLCRCECGAEKAIQGCSLTNGTTRSCGCWKSEEVRTRMTKHGHTSWHGPRTPTYRCWRAMLGRCYRVNDSGFKYYGGRGISVCERWRDFRNFLADMGERPTLAHSIDRIDNNGNYEPGNCRWATALQQGRNSRKTVQVTLNGETHCISEWMEILDLNVHTIKDRLHRGWSYERALTEPIKHRLTKQHPVPQSAPSSQSPSEAP